MHGPVYLVAVFQLASLVTFARSKSFFSLYPPAYSATLVTFTLISIPSNLMERASISTLMTSSYEGANATGGMLSTPERLIGFSLSVLIAISAPSTDLTVTVKPFEKLTGGSTIENGVGTFLSSITPSAPQSRRTSAFAPVPDDMVGNASCSAVMTAGPERSSPLFPLTVIDLTADSPVRYSLSTPQMFLKASLPDPASETAIIGKAPESNDCPAYFCTSGTSSPRTRYAPVDIFERVRDSAYGYTATSAPAAVPD